MVPGTGKSSLSLAIVGLTGLDIFMISFSNFNDNSLEVLFGGSSPTVYCSP